MLVKHLVRVHLVFRCLAKLVTEAEEVFSPNPKMVVLWLRNSCKSATGYFLVVIGIFELAFLS